MNLISGSVFGAEVPEGDDVRVGFRPEYTRVTSRAGEPRPYALHGTVSIVENLGATMLVSVVCGEHSVQALVPDGDEPPVDSEVTLSPDERRVLFYDATSGELRTDGVRDFAAAGAPRDA